MSSRWPIPRPQRCMRKTFFTYFVSLSRWKITLLVSKSISNILGLYPAHCLNLPPLWSLTSAFRTSLFPIASFMMCSLFPASRGQVFICVSSLGSAKRRERPLPAGMTFSIMILLSGRLFVVYKLRSSFYLSVKYVVRLIKVDQMKGCVE